MKIIHTSDLHLASALTSRLSSDRVRERKRELMDGFRKTVSEAEKIGAAAIIIAGDLFDSERASGETVEQVLTVMERAQDILFFYLPGNHEGRLIEKSGRHLPKNLLIFKDEWTYFKLGDINIIGRSETKENMFSELSLSEKEKNIVVLHGELREHSEENGVIGVKELSYLPIDYLALGHYHTYSYHTLSERTTAVYPGTPEGRGFDETGDKGYVIMEVDRYGIYHQFRQSAKRALRIAEVDITALERRIDIEDRIEESVSKIHECDLVRVVLKGKRPLGIRYDIDSLTSLWKTRFYYFELKDDTRVSFCADDFKNDKSLKGEFIRGVLADDSLSDDIKENVITMGLRALLGEEVD